jgi:probable HAF family extracellular repeat protein
MNKSYSSLVATVAFSLLAMSSAVQAQTKYTVIDLGALEPGFSDSGINNRGDVIGVVNDVACLYTHKTNTFQILGTIVPGFGDSGAAAVNNFGEVVGWSLVPPIAGQPNDEGRLWEAFLYINSIKGLGWLPVGASSFANSINDMGEIVGSSQTDEVLSKSLNWNGPSHAFLYRQNKMIDLGTLPGDTNSSAYGINSSGQIVGTSDEHTFLYSNGRMRNIGGDFTPAAINDHGQIIGNKNFTTTGTPPVFYTRGYLYEGGLLRNLGTLPTFPATKALSINNSGEIVGTCSNSALISDPSVGFLWNGSIHQITVPGWTIISASGINDSGQIAATGTRPVGTTNEEHALLLTPVR